MTPVKVIVFHRGYGCETGCCGHAIEVDGEELAGSFTFSHPYGSYNATMDERDSAFRAFAEELIVDHLGADHVADLDWENCIVTDDC